MSGIMKKGIAFAFCALTALSIVLCAFFATRGEVAQGADEPTVSITADTGGKLTLVSGTKSDYIVVYATAYQLEQQLANDLRTLSGGALSTRADWNQTKPLDKEIIIGEVAGRNEVTEFLSVLNAKKKSDDDLVYGYAVYGNKLIYLATSKTAFNLGMQEFKKFLDDADFSVSTSTTVIKYKTMAEYEAELEADKEAQRQKRIEELMALNEQFKNEKLLNGYKREVDATTGKQLGIVYSPYKKMIGTEEEVASGKAHYSKNPYESPWVYPTEGEHPRYLLNSDSLATIKSYMDNPDYKNLFANLYALAEYDINNGIFIDRDANGAPHDYMNPTGETYRYSEKILSAISARAMMYLLTGDEVYAYEAIVGIKNAIITLKYTQDLHVDIYHGASHVMVVLAAVYDWCYPVMTDTDRWQIINGTVGALWPTMEFTYPPVNMSAVAGHGTGPQFLRDYVSIAIAFYDECPDWYELIFGRYFEQYLPAANVKFESGLIPGGTTTYAPIKIHVQLWSAYLLKVSTGEHFITEDIAIGVKYMLEHIMPNGNYFQTGDGDRKKAGQPVGYAEFFTLLGLTGDPLADAWAKYLSNDYSKYITDSIFTMTPDFQLCFIASAGISEEEKVDKYEALPLAEYFEFPVGYIMARNSWTSDAAAVMMKLQNKNTQDHDVYDHGTFQIYYKGLLAGTSGSYKKFGSAAHYQYLHSTIAHNGLLIFNPSKIAPISKDKDGNILNQAVCYYSGSQVMLGAPATIEDWNENYEIVDTTGHQIGYFADGTPKYAYLAGDMTDAYEQDTVDFVSRSMFTLYTGKTDIPMVFFTFDQIASDKDYYEKSYLIHTVNEPTVNAADMSAEIVNGGKLVVKSLYGADKIEAVGGEGKYFWINDYYDENGEWHEGREIWDKYLPENYGEAYWGRLQLRASGEKESKLLTAMYVTDGKSTATLDFDTFIENGVYGATFAKDKVVFLEGRDKAYREFSFNSGNEKGLFSYYLFGISDGTWQVTVDGVSVAYVRSEGDEGMISFVAPAGEVTLIPGGDVFGADGGKIIYSSGGATLPEDTKYSYTSEDIVTLPETAVRGDDMFLGWYLTPDCLPEDRVYEVPYGQTGTFRVYAKWLLTYVNEDYTETKLDLVNTTMTTNGIYYVASKTGANMTTKTDKNGVNYLEWVEGTRDPFIQMTSSINNIATSTADDMTISYTVKFSPHTDAQKNYTNMQSDFVIRAKRTVTNEGISGGVETVLFSTKTNGDVMLGSSTKIAQLYPGEVTTVRIAVDYKNGKIMAYDEVGDLISAIDYAIPKVTGAQNTEELMKCYNEILFDWRARTSDNVSTAAIRVYGIKMQEGNAFGDLKNTLNSDIIYVNNGGEFSSDAVSKFSRTEETPLPTAEDISRYGYDFGGWYTTSNFADGTQVSAVPAGVTERYFRVYAKWTLRTDTLYYDLKGGAFANFKLPDFYDKENGTDLTAIVPERYGYVFDGWYDNEHYTGEEITLLGKGAQEPITLYAKWKIRPDTLYCELDGGTLFGTLPDFYDKVNGTPLLTPTKQGCTFDGWYTTPDFTAESKLTDTVGIGGTEPITIYAKWLVPDNTILYDLKGGKITGDAPNSYVTGTGLTLPTAVTKDGHIFGGWYISSHFDGVRINEIPADAVGGYYLYAKWLKVLMVEDYSETKVNSVGTNTGAGKGPFSYNTLNAVTPIKTVEDESGNIYLTVSVDPDGKGNKIIYYSSSSYNLTHFTDSAISYEIDLWKIAGKTLSDVSFYIPTTSSKFGSLSVATVKGATGGLMLSSTDEVATVITETRQTVRLTVDFARGTALVYDENGNVLSTSTLTVPTITAAAKDEGYVQPTTLLEWQKIAVSHLLFISFSGADSQVGLDNVRVIEGRIFEKDRTTDSIIYNTKGGTMPASYPKTYSAAGTDISGVVPTKFGYVFGGWYDENGEAVTSVGIGNDAPVSVYAKWDLDPTVIHFNLGGGAFDGSFPTNYDPVSGTLIGNYDSESGVYTTDYAPTRYGYVFAGWYLTSNFDGEPVGMVGAGATEQITLYAKWNIDPRTIYVDLDGGVLEGALPDFYDPKEGTDISAYLPTKENYTFAGWYLTPNFVGEPVTVIGKDATAPITLYARWTVADGTVLYDLGGGTMQESTASTYDPATATTLPTAVTRKGYIFGGWYLSSKFDGERITEIPAGATGGYAFYAKWLKIFTDEDYDTTLTIVDTADKVSVYKGEVNYNPASLGVSMKTVKENGNTYLLVTSTENGTAQVAKSETYNFKTMGETAISYQVSVRKKEGVELQSFQLWVPTKGSKYGTLTIASSKADGSFKLGNSSVEIAKFTEYEWTTVRVTLDFASGEAIAYDEYGNVLDRSKLTVPKLTQAALDAGIKQPATLAEWQRLEGVDASEFPYLVYLYSTGTGAIMYDNFKIIEGRAFENTLSDTSIVYNLSGGELDCGIHNYDPVLGTDISSVIPTKAGYLFDGWYTTPTFDDGTKIEGTVGKNGTALINLYAKWALDYTTITFEPDGGKMPQAFPTNYDRTNGTDVSGVIPTKDGYVFAGWFEDAELTQKATTVGVGKAEPITLYAKWDIRPDTLYCELDGGALENALPKYYDQTLGALVTGGEYNPTKYGYVFLGWYTSPDFSEDSRVNADFAPTPLAPITLYAKWGIDPHRLFVELDGGVLEGALPDFYDQDLAVMLENFVPTKADSEFGGWYTDASFAPEYKITADFVPDGTAYITIYARWILPSGAIFYDLGGGTLAEDAPTSYDTAVDTLLPEATLAGYVFAGWHTDAEFTSERVTYIPKGALGGYYFYAKWLKVFVSEDYDTTGTEIDVKDKVKDEKTLLIYNPTQNGVSIKTVSEDGNKYLYVTSTVSASAQVVKSGSFKTMTETAISYQVSVRAKEGETLRKFSLWIPTSGSKYGTLTVGSSDTSGNFKLANSSKVVAKFTAEEWTTVRVTLDFASGEAVAYDAEGNELDRSKLTVPTLSADAIAAGIKQPTSLAEWQRLEGITAKDMPYFIYFYSDGVGTILFDDIQVIEGRAFGAANNAVTPHNSINYVLDDGVKLPEGYAKLYDTVGGTTLPTPSRPGYEFLGWYLDKNFSGEAVSAVGAGEDGDRAISVYAKWRFITNTIVYGVNGGTMPDEYTAVYDMENGTDVTKVVPTRKGYRFDGWYASESYEGTRASVVGAGMDSTIYLYAKWLKVLVEENYERENEADEVEVPAGENTPFGAMEYNTKNNGCSFTTLTDTQTGNKYLEVTANGTASVYKSASYNLKTMEDTAISFEISLWAIDGAQLSRFALYIPTAGSKCGSLSIVSCDKNGNLKLDGVGEDTFIGNVTEGRIDLRITVDFATGYAYAFDKDGAVIASSFLTVPTIKDTAITEGLAEKQPETLAEWQRIAVNHLAHFTCTGEGKMAFDNIAVLEGRAFGK